MSKWLDITMTCYSPLHAFKGKSEDASKIAITFKRNSSWRGERLDLPCGQCIGCRLERSRQWAVRCMHEASMFDKNCFLTLTYDEDNIPKGEPGEICPRRHSKPHLKAGSLCVADFQDFMKRLRKENGKGIRYYHCGEYGEKFGRPHYHALLFNYDFDDKKFFSGENERKVYTSENLQRLWPKGFSLVGEVTFESASYVARYCMKKVTGVKSEDHYGGLAPEYSTMSRGSKKIGTGGIGKSWFERFKSDVYPLDRLVVRGSVTRPPRFYDNLLGHEDPSLLALLKINREKNSIKFVDDVLSDGRKIRVSDSDGSRLLVKELVKKAQISNLRRPLEEI